VPTGTIVFTAQAGVEYSINNGTSYQASATFSGLAPGSYTLRVRSTTDNTCSTQGAAVVIDDLPVRPILTVTGVESCNPVAGTYSVSFNSNATTVASSAGTVSGSTVTGIPLGMNVVITASNGAGCTTVQTFTGPATCPVDCSYPLLTVGNATCNGVNATTYSVAFSVDPSATSVTITGGTNNGNGTATANIGTNMVITATVGTCLSVVTVPSPANCTDPCDDPFISVSGAVCTSGTAYRVNFTTISGATVTSSAGTVSGSSVTGIPAGTAVTLTISFPGCDNQQVTIASPVNCAQPDIALIKTASIPANASTGDMIAYTFMVTNTGNITLTNITVTDPLPGLSVISPASVASLAPGAMATFTANYTITPTDVTAGGVTNQATAMGTPPTGPNVMDLSDDNSNLEDDPTVTPIGNTAILAVKVLLQGALYGTSNGLMRDDLRTGGYLPLTEPYTALGGTRFTHVGGGGGETTTTGVLALNAGTPDAIVDWVFVELRSASNPTQVLFTRSALVQRDGDVVDAADGVSPLTYGNSVGQSYFVSVKHRNHLGAMTAAAQLFTVTPKTVDFTTASDADLYDIPGATNYNGVEMVNVTAGAGSVNALWAGNTNADNKVKYQGPANDNSLILAQVIGHPNNTATAYNYNFAFGYLNGDVNMDGKVKYQGVGSDPVFIFSNVLGLYSALNTAALYNYDLLREQLP